MQSCTAVIGFQRLNEQCCQTEPRSFRGLVLRVSVLVVNKVRHIVENDLDYVYLHSALGCVSVQVPTVFSCNCPYQNASWIDERLVFTGFIPVQGG
jgi:hypothetical protein